MRTILLHTGEQLVEIHYEVALHCMIPNCQRKFVLQNASKESFLLDVHLMYGPTSRFLITVVITN